MNCFNLRNINRKISLFSFLRNTYLKTIFRDSPIFNFTIKVSKRVNTQIIIKLTILFKRICKALFLFNIKSNTFFNFNGKKSFTTLSIKI